MLHCLLIILHVNQYKQQMAKNNQVFVLKQAVMCFILTVDSRYNDIVGIREKYQYIQTIDISSSIESYLVMAGILK